MFNRMAMTSLPATMDTATVVVLDVSKNWWVSAFKAFIEYDHEESLPVSDDKFHPRHIGTVFPNATRLDFYKDNALTNDESDAAFQLLFSSEHVGEWPASLIDVCAPGNEIRNVRNWALPYSVLYLNVSHNAIRDVVGWTLPPRLSHLNVCHNAIRDVVGWTLPPLLARMDASDNAIGDVADWTLPPRMTHLVLRNNQIRQVNGFSLPANMERLRMTRNPIDADDFHAWAGLQVK